MAEVKNSKFVWRKKNPPRAQIFRYFRIESRNNNLSQMLKLWVEKLIYLPIWYDSSIIEKLNITKLLAYQVKIMIAPTAFQSFLKNLFENW